MKTGILFFLAAAVCVPGAEDDGFVSLFNGRDLTGWVNANCAPDTWSVRDGVIHCTGRPTGALRTTRQYENFILEVDWRHLSSGGNSGVFIWGTPIAAPGVPFLRGIEVQVLDHGYAEKYEKENGKKSDWFTTHGDVFPIHGAIMKPFGPHRGNRSFPTEERSKRSPEWNHYHIVCSNGVLRLHVNGKEVSGGEDCNYRKGYLALESEGAPVEFRNIRIKELRSSGASSELTAPLDQNWRPLFTGLDLRGWQTNAAIIDRWRVNGERLSLRSGASDLGQALKTDASFVDAEFIIDCRLGKPAQGEEVPVPEVEIRGARLKLTGAQPGNYQRFIVLVKAGQVSVRGKDGEILMQPLASDAPARGPFGLRDTGGPVEFMNLYVRDL